MSDLTPTETPDYRNGEHIEMAPGWALVSDLRRGQRHMRGLKQKYLPKNSLETPKKYGNRVAMTRFYNVYSHTEESLVGLAFRKDPVLGSDVPAFIRGTKKRGSGIAENIDLQGTHLSLFLRQIFKWAFDGHAFIHVEMPPKLPGKPSRLDAVKAGRRPYWRPYRAEQALNWDIGNDERGVPRLKQISFLEAVQVQDGRFGKKFKSQYRVLVPGGWELWEETVADGRTSVTRVAAEKIDLKEIPVAPVYGHKTGALTSRPPLEDLAWENVYHFQLCSEFRNVTHIANTPVMVRVNAKMGQDGNPLPFGVDKIIDVGLQGDAKWMEHNGRAIPHARTEIKDSEGRMAVIGVSLVGGRPEIETTATKSVLDNVEQTSSLGLMVRSLVDGAERCMGWSSEFMGEGSDGGSLNMNKSFNHLQLDAGKIDALSRLVEAEQLTTETLWAILQRAEELPDEFDVVEEAKRLAKAREADGAGGGGKPGEKDDKPGKGSGDDPAEE
ncbi:MAG TPA: DUF4055 domain-containing protein [Pyrinomonadaceae bacterium]|jgi:hypothetical protein